MPKAQCCVKQQAHANTTGPQADMTPAVPPQQECERHIASLSRSCSGKYQAKVTDPTVILRYYEGVDAKQNSCVDAHNSALSKQIIPSCCGLPHFVQLKHITRFKSPQESSTPSLGGSHPPCSPATAPQHVCGHCWLRSSGQSIDSADKARGVYQGVTLTSHCCPQTRCRTWPTQLRQ